jgi:hypothetical protein
MKKIISEWFLLFFSVTCIVVSITFSILNIVGKIMGQIMKPIEHQQIYKERAYRVEPMQGLIKEISILVGGKAVDGIRPADHVIARLPVPFGWVAVPAGDSP